MKIGVVKRFGLKKKDGDGISFGFLTEAGEGGEEVYFNEKLIAPASKFKENYRKDSFVVYEVRQFKKGRAEAYDVRLLAELDGKEQLRLYRECRDGNRGAELELLRDYWRHPGKSNKCAKWGSVKKFGLIDKYGKRFGFLANLFGADEKEIYFNEETLSPSLEKECRKTRYGQKLFLKNRNVIFWERQINKRWTANKVALPEDLDEQALHTVYQEWRDRNQSEALEWLFDQVPALFSQESDEELIFLILMMKAGGHRVSRILECRPELLWTSPEVCACIDGLDIILMPQAQLVTTDEQVAFLARHVMKEKAWHEIVLKLPNSLVLKCPRALGAVRHSRAVSLLSGIDITAASEAELERLDILLGCIDWDRLTESEMVMIRPLLERKPDEYIASLITQRREKRHSVAFLLKWKPELLWTSPEVCACVEWNDVRDLPLDELIPTNEPECRHTLLAKFDWRSFRSSFIRTPSIEPVRPLLERESDEYIISLITQTRAAGKDVALLLEWKPELLWTSPEVCACVQKSDIANISSSKLVIQTDEQAAFGAKYAGEDAWSCIAGHLSGTVLLHCQRAMDSITEYQAHSLLSQVDWTAAGEEDLERGRTLLAKVDWSRPVEPSMAAISPLLERETYESMVSLVTQTRAAGRGVFALLEWKPELLWTSPEVCACVRGTDIRNLPVDQLIRTDEQAAFLAEHAGEDLWKIIVGQLSGNVLLHCRRALDMVTENQACELLSNADWTDTGEDNLANYRPLLAKLHWDVFSNAVITAAGSLRAQGMALELCWWQMMTETMKIRLLMYLSDFAEEERAARRWFGKLQVIRQWEDERKNVLVCAILQFFAGIYIEASASYLDNFLKAHDMLMAYITDCFNQGLDMTPELSVLLEHCRSNSCSENVLCDGRSWVSQNRVYCPRRGYPCEYYTDMDLTKTIFRTARREGCPTDYKDFSFMDFLLSLNRERIPDLTRIGIRKREEYPFRISAYVNSLIRLRPHMKCSQCGELFHPRFQYAKLLTARLPITVFNCSKLGQEGEHDYDVYLNFCYRCHEIIDSRECCCREKLSASGEFEGVIPVQENMPGPRSEYGQYLCMHCGGSAHVNPEKNPVCPKCGCNEPMHVSRTRKGGIICGQCGYDSSKFRSKFENALYQSR